MGSEAPDLLRGLHHRRVVVCPSAAIPSKLKTGGSSTKRNCLVGLSEVEPQFIGRSSR